MTGVTHHELLEWLGYDPATGVFAWRKSPRNQTLAGSRAGSLEADGYRRIKLKGRKYREHRLAIFYMTGEWPTEADHRDRDRQHNAYENLRDATPAQNRANRGQQKNNSSGFKGVSRCGKKWRADGAGRYLGLRDTPEEAHELYKKCAIDEYGEFAHDGIG